MAAHRHSLKKRWPNRAGQRSPALHPGGASTSPCSAGRASGCCRCGRSIHRIPIDAEAIASLLDQGGLISQHFPGFEHRPQQIEMTYAVAQALNQERHLMVEAGTGTGKSLAYLLPAVHWAVENQDPVIISTNTINLQDQLIGKDIPDLHRTLPLEFRAAILKGRSNYVCPRLVNALRRTGPADSDEMRLLAKLLVWLPQTKNRRTGRDQLADGRGASGLVAAERRQ